MYKEIFTKNIKKAREQAGMTQLEVCKCIGISQPTISSIEKGTREPNLETLCKLIDLYKVDANMILGLSNNNIWFAPRKVLNGLKLNFNVFVV